MVSYVKEEGEEQKKVQSLNPKSSKETSTVSFDSTLFEPFIDFDSIKEFFEDNPDMASLEKIGLDEETKEKVLESTNRVGDHVVKEERVDIEESVNLGSLIEQEMRQVSLSSWSSLVLGHFGTTDDRGVDVKEEVSNKDQDQRSGSNHNTDGDIDESRGESESESESSSSSSSSDDSSADNDDDDKEDDNIKSGNKGENLGRDDEIEEGEITDVQGEEMVRGGGDEEEEDDEDEQEDEEDANNKIDWSDVALDDAEVDEDESDSAVPIRSKNEVKVLPPVPPVNVTLQEYHQMLPVGVVSSVIGPQVIIEGAEKHDPLSEGSILWVTENRSPLGLVDEIFGPVKNPFYIVRYNSESEVPAGICQGTLVSFVPEFVDHVLHNQNLYKKGYDASGVHDEEMSGESEFSDDEKEQEYRRKQRMSKRAVNEKTIGKKKKNRKNFKGREQNLKNSEGPSNLQVPACGSRIPLAHTKMQQNDSPVAGCDFSGGAGFIPSFPPPTAQSSGVFQPPVGVGAAGMLLQQPQGMVGGFPPANMAWPALNELQHPNQIPMPFPQQFHPVPGLMVPNAFPQMNPFAQPTTPMWTGVAGQNSINQPAMGMCFPVQPTQPAMNMMNMRPGAMQFQLPMMHSNPVMNMLDVGNGAMPRNPSTNMMNLGGGMVHVFSADPNSSAQPMGLIPGNFQVPQQFNVGTSPSNSRRKPPHRGSARFIGGRDSKP